MAGRATHGCDEGVVLLDLLDRLPAERRETFSPSSRLPYADEANTAAPTTRLD
ncbi:hypothetical protein [Streptomyces pseudogriseolus]|uniref:hypothetical protein n=1 Tax=Streptomyces pseudogriseolus TaxID=36817 RepID=UPI003FA203A7